ncbi:MAG: peptidylprolyl isomerase [Roseitalea porphyridii]|uniref:foldase protein PrsA n=1 Tax=Roseitalea porphyridii TaxID=1852022 RepID=UPI0032EF5E06
MLKNSFATVVLATGMTVAMALPPVLAQETASSEPEASEVIARVNGDELYEIDLIAFIQRLPPQLQSQVQMLMPQILDQLVNNKLTTQAGRAAGLAEDEEVKDQVAKIEDLIVGQVFLQRSIDDRVTDEKIEVAYQDFLKENPPQRELQARHILLATEEEAKAVIAELDGGADFAALAKERSTGPSGAKGGELPPFQAGQMVPEFSDAAFAMEIGSYSAVPVKTQFGFHVILLEDSRLTEPPVKADMEEQLRDQLSQTAAQEVYAALRDGAEIEVLLGQSEAGSAGGEADPASNEMAPAMQDQTPDGGEVDSAPASN